MTDSTILRLVGTSTSVGIPPYSARGLSETIVPITASQQLRRTVNGALVDFSSEQFRKFAISITGDDQDPPAFNAVWPGTQLIIDCISEFAYESMSGAPERTAVAGSERTADGFIFYRPQLTVRVVGFSKKNDEWGRQIAWQLDLEEV